MLILYIIIGLVIGFFIIVIDKSIYMPEARQIQAIMLFKKLYKIISNVEGKKVNNKEKINPIDPEKWDLIDGKEKRWFSNFHFFLWPFCTLYTYPLTYVKEKKIGEQQEGDIMIWKDENTKTCFVSRSGTSDHLEWRVEYPTITSNLDTKELAAVNVFTNNMVEVKNPSKAFFGIKNYLEATYDILAGGLRGLVSEKQLNELNEYTNKEKIGFNDAMQAHANTEIGLSKIGLSLFKSVFKDFAPANDTAIRLMASFAEVTIATQTGQAKVKLAEKEVEVAKQKALAYEAEQEKIVMWRKKYLVDTGLARTDASGNIIELIADANTRLSTEALKELSKLKGTLVLDSGSLNKMFNINPEKKEV